MPNTFSVDANVLVYEFSRKEPVKQATARAVVAMAIGPRCKYVLQVVGEFFNACTKKKLLTVEEAAAQVRLLLAGTELLVASPSDMEAALRHVVAGRLSFWDAVLVETVARGGCRYLLTEDMQDGATIGGVRIVNPFGAGGLSPAAAEVLGLAA